jgi:hypothetical protein
MSEEVVREWRRRVDEENLAHMQKTRTFVDASEKVGPGVVPVA